MSGPKMVNTNPLDALDFQSPEFRGKGCHDCISSCTDNHRKFLAYLFNYNNDNSSICL